MMHKADNVWERCLILFQGHLSNFKVTRLKKIANFYQNWAFRTVTPVWIYWWLWNDAQSLKQHKRGALWFSRPFVKFQGHRGHKIADFDPNWAFPDCKFEFNDGFEMMHKVWRGIEEVPYCFSMWSIKFQGHTGQKVRRFWTELSASGL